MPARAGGLDAEPFALAHDDARRLDLERGFGPGAVQKGEPAPAAGLSAGEAPGGVGEALARAVEQAVMPDRPDDAVEPAPAPEPPRAAGALQQAVTLDPQGYSVSMASTGRLEVLVMPTCTPSLPCPPGQPPAPPPSVSR